MGTEVSLRTKAAFERALSQLTQTLDRSLEDQKRRDDFLEGVDAVVEAMKSGKITCRVYTRDKFHAKAYIARTSNKTLAMVGSSNFTVPGLTENVELNTSHAGEDADGLAAWFDLHWDQGTDVTTEILQTVERHVRLYSPFDVYAKSLEQLFLNATLGDHRWEKKLVVEVVDESGSLLVINADTIKSVVESQPAELAGALKPVLAMAEASLTLTDRLVLAPPNAANAPKWSKECVPEDVRAQVHAKLETGDLAPLTVPMQCRLKGKQAVDCRFDVFLQRDPSVSEGQIIFIREGIIITDVRPRRTSGIRALVVIDEGPLASFLGDSENPSHTRWEKESVKEKYVYAPAHLDYVIQSVPAILAIISEQQKKPDTSLLVDLFSLPAEIETGPKTKQKQQKKKDGGETDSEDVDIPVVPRRFIVDKIANGFAIRRGDPGAQRPLMLAVKVAYGVRRGSPFTKYNTADFQLGLGGIDCNFKGSELCDFAENWMRVEITEADFEITVTGFDTDNRDLHVDVRIRDMEVADATAT
jgi:hypothetical protein